MTMTNKTINTRTRFHQKMVAAALMLAALCPVLWTQPAAAGGDASLADTVRQAVESDRSGACLAVAIIDKGVDDVDIEQAFVCADAGNESRIGPSAAFEIGSVTKTMTTTLLAALIDEGEASLDDPLAVFLPDGARVPEWQGQPILLRHVVTHSSGLPPLPPGVDPANPMDPYADMKPQEVIEALGRVELDGPPGERPGYSNFAFMLLSQGLENRTGTGTEFETLLNQDLFAPLGMENAYITHRPEEVEAAAGHWPGGQAVPAWNFPSGMAGVGGVRATLSDMVAWVQAQIDPDTDTLIGRAIALTHENVEVAEPLAEGMGWFIRGEGEGRTLWHEGGTGGFSSLVAFQPASKRGVVVLADTALTDTGGLGELGMHLLDGSVPLPEPRRRVSADRALLDALAGNYRLSGGLAMELTHENGDLYIQAAGQPRFRMSHDSRGDFYPLQFSALLRPVERADGRWLFTWHQGGGVQQARRVDSDKAPEPAKLDEDTLADYEGVYSLAPQFDLSVKASSGRLEARATGQGWFELEATGEDVFEAPAWDIVIRFRRDGQGRVTALALHQAGHETIGEKQ